MNQASAHLPAQNAVMSTPDVIDVVLVEDLREVREGLTALLNGTRGFRCVGSYHSMEAALAGIGDDAPDVILTDIGLPGMSGVEGIVILRQRFADVPILALTIYDTDNQVFEALCAGASGYLLKNTAPARLLDSIQEAVLGGAPMSPEVATRVVRLFREFRPPESASYHLTRQEIELLKLLIEGHYKKTAAREMGISTNTVSFHLKNIYLKLQVHSKTEAVAKALRERLL
ncbi:MAG TPA: response regulator transcription factor [Pyrinomonadaceae bacterium]|nr:response regulator transcription factor [Pyrinomonadaceae bacterium]